MTLVRFTHIIYTFLNFTKQQKGPFKMRIYERLDFEGQMHELTDDCDSIQDQCHMSDVQSCNVMDGYWLMFELPHFAGKMYLSETRTVQEPQRDKQR